MSSPPKRHPPVELVVIAGPDQGLRLRLKPDQPTLIGRSSKGLLLTDPLVSLRHAEVSWKDGELAVVDLGSAKGTSVGGKAVAPELPRPLEVGDVIALGETQIRVERWDHRMMRRALIAVLSVVVVGMIWNLAATGGGMPPAEDGMAWHSPIRQGLTSSSRLEPDPVWARKHGIDWVGAKIRRVTDFDGNGIDEVWLRDGGRDHIITFDDDGSWRHLGALPAGCSDDERMRLGAGTFPVLRCPGTRYELVDGVYRLTRQEGVVVWATPEEQPTEEEVEVAAVSLHRTALSRPDRLAGFLAARGVTEPVAWILCEGALPELRPQVRTARGEIKPLRFGCHKDLTLHGRADGRVLAVATTGAGREALIDDLRRFFGGAEDGLFLSPDVRRRIEEWGAEPGYLRGGMRLDAEGAEQFFSPVPAEGPVPGRATPLAASGHNAAPAALTATLLSSGKARLDPPGCAMLEVTTGPWNCEISAGCRAASTFLTVHEVGCGERAEVLSVPYAGGTVDGHVDGLQVRAVVQASGGVDRILQARVTYRKEAGSRP